MRLYPESYQIYRTPMGTSESKSQYKWRTQGFWSKKKTSSFIKMHDLLILCHRENGGTLRWYSSCLTPPQKVYIYMYLNLDIYYLDIYIFIYIYIYIYVYMGLIIKEPPSQGSPTVFPLITSNIFTL